MGVLSGAFLLALIILSILAISSLSYKSSEESLFSLLTGEITLNARQGQTNVVIANDRLLVELGNVKKTVNIGKITDKTVSISFENKNYILKKGSNIITDPSGSNAIKINVVKIDNGKATLSLTPEINAGRTKPVPIKPTTKKRSILSDIFDRFGIGKGFTISEEPELGGEIDRPDYPVYELDRKKNPKLFVSKEEQAVTDFFYNMRSTKRKGFLSSSEYGLLLTLQACNNRRLDYDLGESDLDCGGPCLPCGEHKLCDDHRDCRSNACQSHRCVPEGLPICVEDGSGIVISNEFFPRVCRDENTILIPRCIGPDIKTFVENERICPEGTRCSNGDCVAIPSGSVYCFDSDPENDLYILGQARLSNSDEYSRDRCLNDLEITQVTCSGNVVDYSPVQACPDNKVCSSGVCISRDYCTEPNPQESFPDATVFESESSAGFRRHIDECATEARVRHIICDGTFPAVSETDCPENTLCNNGICGDVGHPCLRFENYAVDSSGETYYDRCGSQRESPRLKYIATCLVDDIVGYSLELCNSDEVCMWGRCVKTSCTDSDGENIYNFGNTRGNLVFEDHEEEFLWYDTCIIQIYPDEPVPLTDTVYEQVCDNNHRPLATYNPCPETHHCFYGRCIEGQRQFSCTDSDGMNIFSQGYVQTERESYSPLAILHFDSCQSDRIVREYVCRDNGYYSYSNNPCPEDFPWCDYGACSKGIDTDPTGDIFTRGEVTDINGIEHPDFCRGDKVVDLTYDKETGQIIEEEKTCPENFACLVSNPGVCSPIIVSHPNS